MGRALVTFTFIEAVALIALGYVLKGWRDRTRNR